MKGLVCVCDNRLFWTFPLCPFDLFMFFFYSTVIFNLRSWSWVPPIPRHHHLYSCTVVHPARQTIIVSGVTRDCISGRQDCGISMPCSEFLFRIRYMWLARPLISAVLASTWNGGDLAHRGVSPKLSDTCSWCGYSTVPWCAM